jgi:polar amino acid transport system ATP-binding protein
MAAVTVRAADDHPERGRGVTLDARAIAVQRGGRLVVDDMSFAAGPGELVAIMGASGSGKTTVLRSVAGLDALAAGTIEVGGVTLTAAHGLAAEARRRLHRVVGIVFQFHHLFSHMSALDNVSLAQVHVLGRSRRAADDRARALLEGLGVGGRAGAMPHQLSGGEAQRVAIARALAVDPAVLLMDEPTASLDHARRDDLAMTLHELRTQGRTIVIATHDQEFARAAADRVIVMHDGRLVREG